jgi:hypothetical protein
VILTHQVGRAPTTYRRWAAIVPTELSRDRPLRTRADAASAGLPVVSVPARATRRMGRQLPVADEFILTTAPTQCAREVTRLERPRSLALRRASRYCAIGRRNARHCHRHTATGCSEQVDTPLCTARFTSVQDHAAGSAALNGHERCCHSDHAPSVRPGHNPRQRHAFGGRPDRCTRAPLGRKGTGAPGPGLEVPDSHTMAARPRRHVRRGCPGQPRANSGVD